MQTKQPTRAARVHHLLDRPGGRAGLGLFHSARHLAKHREWVAVRWRREGYWELRFPDAVVAQPYPYLAEYREKEEIARDAYFHRYEPKAGDVVMHVGAGAGWEVNLLSRSVGPTGHVFVIEAQPRTFEWLSKRVAASRLSNVTPICVAVSDHEGVVSISDMDRHQLNRLVEGQGVEVTCTTIPQILIDHDIDHVDLLSINIEGGEGAALSGLGSAAQSIRRIAVSCHDFLADRGGDDATRTREDVRATLHKQGFKVVRRDQSDPRDWARDYLYAERDGDAVRI